MSRSGAGGGGVETRAAIAGIAFGAIAGLAAALAWPVSPPASRQPVAFNHRLHARDHQIGCDTCHAFEAPAPFSGLPETGVCATCHAEALGKSAEEAKVVAAAAANVALPWEPLFREPRHVFFSHRLHAVSARIACDTCHPAIAEARAPPARVRTLRMSDCLSCHAQAGGPTRCTACHR